MRQNLHVLSLIPNRLQSKNSNPQVEVRRLALVLMVPTAGGRQLAVSDFGAIDGKPVFYLHGTPGSRLGPRPRALLLHQLGVRLIMFDRPGYGESDRQPGRTVANGAADVATIADALEFERFAVVGRSGGGPHALACAALLPSRVTRAAALVALAPSEADGLDWFAGMTRSNVTEFSVAHHGRDAVTERLELAAEWIQADPNRMIAALYADLTDADRRVVANVGIRRMLVSNFAEAFRRSADGWIDDVMALTAPWGFDPADITTPTLVWHGAEDRFCPAGHSAWLGGRIPGATLVLEPGGSHFDALRVLPGMLPWLAAA
jgi:pimeloyl-ACP methyl ester carboxylesterase